MEWFILILYDFERLLVGLFGTILTLFSYTNFVRLYQFSKLLSLLSFYNVLYRDILCYSLVCEHIKLQLFGDKNV